MNTRAKWIGGLGLFLGAAATAQAGAGFQVVRVTPKTLTSAAVTAAGKTATAGKVAADKKTLTFTGKTARLVAATGPENDMLSYRINGLRNPTLVVPKGATLKILFVNTDGDMAHNLRFGAWRAVYPNVVDTKNSVGTPPLPHGTNASRHAEELTLHVPATPGKYNYFCTVRGHAQGGMRGTLLVR